MPRAFKYLVVADDSAEFPAALGYASQRAKVVGGQVVMLRVVDTLTDQAHWVAIGEEMRAEAREAAEALMARLAAEAWAASGVQPEIVIREGEAKTELKRLIDEDLEIRILVLASGVREPGPLVSALVRGHGWGARPIPLLIVPGGLSPAEIARLVEADTGA
jgi:hypothetical protein